MNDVKMSSVVELFEDFDNIIFLKANCVGLLCRDHSLYPKIACSKLILCFEHTIGTGTFRIQIRDLSSSFRATDFLVNCSFVQVSVWCTLTPASRC